MGKDPATCPKQTQSQDYGLPHNFLMKFRGKYARNGHGLNPEYP
jgi:hypothetical protein